MSAQRFHYTMKSQGTDGQHECLTTNKMEGFTMEYLLFSVWFTLIHTIMYMAAGSLALFTFSRVIYEGNKRALDYQRDTADKDDLTHISRWFLPAQLLRGALFSVVLYPILATLGDVNLAMRFLFFFGLLFIYTHVGCASPCSDNIEGFVYMKPKYFQKKSFWKFQMEMILYSAGSAAAAASLLF